METRPDPRVTHWGWSGGSGLVGLQYKACGSGRRLKIYYFLAYLYTILSFRPAPRAAHRGSNPTLRPAYSPMNLTTSTRQLLYGLDIPLISLLQSSSILHSFRLTTIELGWSEGVIPDKIEKRVLLGSMTLLIPPVDESLATSHAEQNNPSLSL